MHDMHDMPDNQNCFCDGCADCPHGAENVYADYTIRDGGITAGGITAEELGVRGTRITCDSITEERIGEIVKLMRQRSAGTPPIPKVIRRRGTATIVEWRDGTQTKVILEQGHPDWGIFGAFCVALAKKVYGNKLFPYTEKPKVLFSSFFCCCGSGACGTFACCGFFSLLLLFLLLLCKSFKVRCNLLFKACAVFKFHRSLLIFY